MKAIKVQNLTRDYNGLRAVDGISFAVETGEIFGFLGPNGAGKSDADPRIKQVLRDRLEETALVLEWRGRTQFVRSDVCAYI